MDRWWNPKWTETLFKIYIVSSIICFLGVVIFWYFGPIEIAQMCGLGLMWSIFGSLINRQGVI